MPEIDVESQVRRILEQALGTPTAVLAVDTVRQTARASVFRLDTSAGRVIVRQLHERTPENLNNFFNAWAGLAFLNEHTGARLCPRFYGGSVEDGLLVEEECSGQALDTLLMTGTAEAAAAALLAYARTLGTLHGRTHGLQEKYLARRQALHAAPTPGVPDSARAAARIEQVLRLLDMPAMPALADNLAAVHRELFHNRAFHTFTHGDPHPENCRVDGNAARLFDFEVCGCRHALIEAVYPQLGFIYSECFARLPAPLAENVLAAYRQALAPGCPAAGDETAFGNAAAAAYVYWGITLFFAWYHLERLLGEDIPWGTATMRQRAIIRCADVAAATQRYQAFERLGDLFSRLSQMLQERWNDLPPAPGLYPAFVDGRGD